MITRMDEYLDKGMHRFCKRLHVRCELGKYM